MEEKMWRVFRRSKRRKAMIGKKIATRNAGSSHRSAWRFSPDFRHEWRVCGIISRKEHEVPMAKLVKSGMADYYEEEELILTLHKQKQEMLALSKDFNAQKAFMLSKLSEYGLENSMLYEHISKTAEAFKEAMLSSDVSDMRLKHMFLADNLKERFNRTLFDCLMKKINQEFETFKNSNF